MPRQIIEITNFHPQCSIQEFITSVSMYAYVVTELIGSEKDGLRITIETDDVSRFGFDMSSEGVAREMKTDGLFASKDVLEY